MTSHFVFRKVGRYNQMYVLIYNHLNYLLDIRKLEQFDIFHTLFCPIYTVILTLILSVWSLIALTDLNWCKIYFDFKICQFKLENQILAMILSNYQSHLMRSLSLDICCCQIYNIQATYTHTHTLVQKPNSINHFLRLNVLYSISIRSV